MRRPGDPRKEVARRREARARVHIVGTARSESNPDGSLTTRQLAEVTLPRAELDAIWSPEYLERLARTYWRFLTRASLGLIRVLYTPTSREVVLIARPFRLLTFHAPEYKFGGIWEIPANPALRVAASGGCFDCARALPGGD